MSSTNISEESVQQEADGINAGFWADAILEIVGNGYIEMPSPHGAESTPDPTTSFTFDMYGGLVNSNTTAFLRDEVGENTLDVLKREDHTTLFTPHVPINTPTVANVSQEEEIAYLKAMLQSSMNSTYAYTDTDASSSLSCLNEEENDKECKIKWVDNSHPNSDLTTMLQNNENSTYLYSNPGTPCFDEDDEEEEIKLAENVLLDSQLDETVKEVFPDDSTYMNNNIFNNIVTDEKLLTLSVRDLNKALKDVPRDNRLVLKQRRRLLKNRGYAQKCRNRRLFSEKVYCEENKQLKHLLELKTVERNMYKTKYENLKTIIRKAKMEREHRKLLEQGTDRY